MKAPTMKNCRYCSRSFKAQGLAPHEKHCLFQKLKAAGREMGTVDSVNGGVVEEPIFPWACIAMDSIGSGLRVLRDRRIEIRIELERLKNLYREYHMLGREMDILEEAERHLIDFHAEQPAEEPSEEELLPRILEPGLFSGGKNPE